MTRFVYPHFSHRARKAVMFLITCGVPLNVILIADVLNVRFLSSKFLRGEESFHVVSYLHENRKLIRVPRERCLRFRSRIHPPRESMCFIGARVVALPRILLRLGNFNDALLPAYPTVCWFGTFHSSVILITSARSTPTMTIAVAPRSPLGRPSVAFRASSSHGCSDL